MFDAYQLNDLDKINLLELKWAHRYGLSTMPKNLHYQNSLELEEVSSPQFFDLKEECQPLILDSEKIPTNSPKDLHVGSPKRNNNSEEKEARKECISSSMIVSATKAFSTIFTFEEPFIEEYHPKEDKQIISEDQLLFNEIYQALEDFAVEADLNYSWEKLNSEGQQFGTRYYKDIDENIQDKLVDDNKNLNTEKLLNFIDGILLNPYDVSIEDINIALDDRFKKPFLSLSKLVT